MATTKKTPTAAKASPAKKTARKPASKPAAGRKRGT